MFLARNTKKKRFKRPRRLDPQKAKNRENRLKKKGLWKCKTSPIVD